MADERRQDRERELDATIIAQCGHKVARRATVYVAFPVKGKAGLYCWACASKGGAQREGGND